MKPKPFSALNHLTVPGPCNSPCSRGGAADRRSVSPCTSPTVTRPKPVPLGRSTRGSNRPLGGRKSRAAAGLGHDRPVKIATAEALAELEREVVYPGGGLDRLRVVQDPVRSRGEAAPRRGCVGVVGPDGSGRRPYHWPAPYWASAWIGGQALARHVLDHPGWRPAAGCWTWQPGRGWWQSPRAGRRGAVIANDIDPYAVAAVGVNARANRVAVTATATTC